MFPLSQTSCSRRKVEKSKWVVFRSIVYRLKRGYTLSPLRTLFGRLIDSFGDGVAALLSIQYRSNEVIMGWSSKSFYDSKLLAASSVVHQTLKLQEAPAANITSDILEILTAPLLFVPRIQPT